MFSNYLKVVLRNFLKYRLYALINVCGLAAGVACCLLIALFVRREFSYDQQYMNAERIYRVSRDLFTPTGAMLMSSNSGPAAALLLQDFSQVERAARLNTVSSLVLSHGTDVAHENQIRFVDAEFFNLFDFNWLQGEPQRAVGGPADIVLTESLARKYFGDADPLGETLTLDGRLQVQVTGVIADLPDNTHLSASGFVSIAALDTLYGSDGQSFIDTWFRINTHTYVLLKPGTSMSAIEDGLAAFTEQHVPAGGFPSAMRITPLTDIHWEEEMGGSLKPAGNFSTIIIFIAIGICILVVACINFINLSTARSSQRAMEVGVRKSVGASQVQLIRQFLGESICLALLAMLLGLALVEIFLPMASALVGQDLTYDYFRNPMTVTGLILSTLALGTAAGIYPATSLASFSASQALKGGLARGERGILLRNALVILQFVVSIVLLICTVSIFSQMRFVSELDLGFKKDQMLVLTLPQETFDQWAPFRQALLAWPEILAVSSSNSNPLQVGQIGGAREEGGENSRIFSENIVDVHFLDTYDIDLLAGRWFAADLAGDRSGDGRGSLIVNEAAAREFGWTPEEALGKSLEHDGVFKPVIGVVGNTIESARSNSDPILYQLPLADLAGDDVSVLVSGNQPDATLAYIDKVWRDFLPDQPIVRQFLDNMVEAQYQTERQYLELSFYFAALSIAIACMGLFGLATFNAQRRTKEIGVRKVMGGSVWSIVLLLSNDFSKLVLLSNLIAWPVAYFAMERWLQNFAYRIDLTPLVFIGSGFIALCIAWVTVGGTAAKAASAKPVLALRYE